MRRNSSGSHPPPPEVSTPGGGSIAAVELPSSRNAVEYVLYDDPGLLQRILHHVLAPTQKKDEEARIGPKQIERYGARNRYLAGNGLQCSTVAIVY